jgi:FtsH-binding integral membrane protein
MVYAAVIGAIISWIFIVYPDSTLGAAFLVTGGTFAAMSIYGFVTKRDLSTIGSYLTMAAFGLFFASIANIFFANDALSWVITYGILAVFIGLTAYYTQQLRDTAVQIGENGELASRYAIVGSIMLYIAFINMFMAILRIMGSRK